MGVLALPIFAATAIGCGELIVPENSENLSVEDFEAAWSFIDSLYPMLREKGIDWDSVHAWYRPKAEVARGDEAHQILHDLVETLRDGHAYYQTVGGGVVFPYVSHRLRRDRSTFSPYVVRRYLSGEMAVTGTRTMEYGFLEGNLGYLRVTTFDPTHMMADLPAVMGFLSGTDGLVLDVRNNDGGELTNVATLVGWFIESPLRWPDAFSQREVMEDVEPPVEPVSPSLRYSPPVAVVVNGAARSAADLLAELMGQIPQVTLVGDTTMGIACQDYDDVNGDFCLPSGPSIHIPTGCFRRYDGVPLEWYGVPPDVRVTQTEQNVREGRDLQLERAVALLKGEASPSG
jgi:hypothetical protein